MITPRPSLSTSYSSSSSSSDGDVFERAEGPASTWAMPPKTTVNVGSVVVQPGATVPGVLEGSINQVNFNVLVNSGDFNPENVDELVSNATKINSETYKNVFSSNNYGYFRDVLGTKEDVEKLSRKWCYLISALVTLSLITLLGTAVLSVTQLKSNPMSEIDPAMQSTLDGLSAEEKQFAEIAGSPLIAGRTNWLAQPSKWNVKNTLPIKMVIVDDTVTRSCETSAECVETVRTEQMVDIEQNHQPDIIDNFLICENGRVYWGRGFDYQGNYTDKFNNGSIGVGFVGDFQQEGPSKKIISTFQKFVDAGVRAGKIAHNYRLVARSQLLPGESTGSSLLRAVETWSHYDSETSKLYTSH